MTLTQLHNLKAQLLALNQSDRAQLALELIDSLDKPADTNVEQAWDIEICRRLNACNTNDSALKDSQDVLSDIRSRISS